MGEKKCPIPIVPAAEAPNYEAFVNKWEKIEETLEKIRVKQDTGLPSTSSAFVSLDYAYDVDAEKLPPSSSAKIKPLDEGMHEENSQRTDKRKVRVRYLSVLFSKISTRKHKKWEGDGFLVIEGRCATLLDENRSVLSSGRSFQYQQLEDLGSGSTLVVGSKEVEVNSELTSAEFHKGTVVITQEEIVEAVVKCEERVTAPTDSTVGCIGVRTSFKAPLRKAEGDAGFLKDVKRFKAQNDIQKKGPAFDPNVPDSLVMPSIGLPEGEEIPVVVDPMLSSKLRPHQKEGVTFLYKSLMGIHKSFIHGAILADDMGLGKSLQCIALLWTLLKQNPDPTVRRSVVSKVLLISPSSLVMNWESEFRKWIPHEYLRVFVLHNKAELKEFQMTCKFNPVLIVSYETFIRCHEEELEKMKFGVVVCDEAHRLKNAATKAHTMLLSLDIPKRILLTGTPIQNDLKELHSLMNLANPGVLGSANKFRKDFEDAIGRTQHPDVDEEEKEWGRHKAEELQKTTSVCLLRRTAEINRQYLPPKVEYILFCRPSAFQCELYRKLPEAKHLDCRVDASSLTPKHLSCIDGLRKLCNHPAILHHSQLQTKKDDYDESMQDVMNIFPSKYGKEQIFVDDSGKLAVLCDLLESVKKISPPQKIVVVSNFTKTLDMVEDLCMASKYRTLRLDGWTPLQERPIVVSQFNSPHDITFVFLLSSKAGGVGLNLVGATRIVLFDLDWNPANDAQAMARVWRDGQKNQCYIYRLITTGTIEERMLQRQIKKHGLTGILKDPMESANSTENLKFSPEELKDIFRLDSNTHCQTHDLMACGCLDGVRDSTPSPLSEVQGNGERTGIKSKVYGIHRTGEAIPETREQNSFT